MGRRCCATTPIYYNWFRPCLLKEVLNTNTEVADFTNQWDFGPFQYRGTTQLSVWQPAENILAASYDYVNSFTDKGWIRKMAPIRYKLNIPGGRQKDSLFGDFAGWHAQSELCPSINAHTVGCKILGLSLGSVVWSPYFGSQGSFSWGRVVIDGVPSAIVNTGFTTSHRYALGISHDATFAISVPISAADVEVWIDLWYTLNLNAGRSTIFDTDYTTLTIHPSTNLDDGFNVHTLGGAVFGATTGAGINAAARIRPTDRWKLTFTGGTVGTLSSIIMEAQTGWTYVDQFPVLIAQKQGSLLTAGNGDSVTIDFTKEAPQIRIVKYNNTSPFSPLGDILYYPNDTGYYDPISGTSIGYLDETAGPVTFGNRVSVNGNVVNRGHRYKTQLTGPGYPWASFPTSVAIERL